MVTFNQSVTLLRPALLATGAVSSTSTATSAMIVREESGLADDHHGFKSQLTLLMPATVVPHEGDSISCNQKNYEIVSVRRCFDIQSGNVVFRVQAIY